LFSHINLISTMATSGGFVYVATTPQLLHIHQCIFSFAKVCVCLLYMY
jgi:hypothetical protein